MAHSADPNNAGRQVNISGKSLSELKLLELAKAVAKCHFIESLRKQSQCFCQS